MAKVYSANCKLVLTLLVLFKIIETICLDDNDTICSGKHAFLAEYENTIYNISLTPFGYRPWPPNCPKCELNFHQQYCVVNNSIESECLIRRAYLETEKSCFTKRGGKRENWILTETLECAYVEVCIFETENDFEFCENNCTLEDFNKIKCESKKGKSFMTKCYRAFIHCPLDRRCVFQDANATNNLYRPIFSENGECGTVYDRLLDRNKTWYWLNQIINERIQGFTALNTVNQPHKICSEVPSEEIPVEPWKIILSTVLVFGAVVALGICLWRLKSERSLWRLKFTDSWFLEWERVTRIPVRTDRFDDTTEIPSPLTMESIT